MRQVLSPMPEHGVLQVLAVRFPTGEANVSVTHSVPVGHGTAAEQFAVQ